MDPLARKVAARYCFNLAMAAGPNPPIPAWVFEWGDRVHAAAIKTAYLDEKQLHELENQKTVPSMPVVLTDAQLVAQARESVSIMLPKFMEMLHKKFNEKFHMNSSGASTRIHYYFATHHPLETIAVMLGIASRKVFLSIMYAPLGLNGAVDYKKAFEQKQVVEDPELAGLALMRLGRSVLGRV